MAPTLYGMSYRASCVAAVAVAVAVDRELGGKYIEKKSEFSIFDIFAEKLIL